MARLLPSGMGAEFCLLEACHSLGGLLQSAAPLSLARHPFDDARIASFLEIAAH